MAPRRERKQSVAFFCLGHKNACFRSPRGDKNYVAIVISCILHLRMCVRVRVTRYIACIRSAVVKAVLFLLAIMYRSMYYDFPLWPDIVLPHTPYFIPRDIVWPEARRVKRFFPSEIVNGFSSFFLSDGSIKTELLLALFISSNAKLLETCDFKYSKQSFFK